MQRFAFLLCVGVPHLGETESVFNVLNPAMLQYENKTMLNQELNTNFKLNLFILKDNQIQYMQKFLKFDAATIITYTEFF